MVRFKGTPGKWLINDTDNKIFGQEDSYHKLSAGIGFFDRDTNEGFELTGFISKHDMLLISKAPEMFEMLEELIAVNKGNGKSVYQAILKAEQLIKEAT